MSLAQYQGTAMHRSQAARIAQLLALDVPEHFTDVELAQRIADGLPTESVYSLADCIGAKQVIGPVVPKAVLRRRDKNSKPLSRQHNGRLYQLSRVIDEISRIYHGEGEKIVLFMTRHHPLLGGKTPLDLTRSSSAGADAVLAVLHRAEAGIAV